MGACSSRDYIADTNVKLARNDNRTVSSRFEKPVHFAKVSKNSENCKQQNLAPPEMRISAATPSVSILTLKEVGALKKSYDTLCKMDERKKQLASETVEQLS